MTTKLTPRTPEQCALIDEAARQLKTGEFFAGYWRWDFQETSGAWVDIGMPSFSPGRSYRTEPAPAHPYYAKFKEWRSLVDSGEVAKGWWTVYQTVYQTYSETKAPNWLPDVHYEICKTNKHPDNKPALKLVDWTKLVGCETSQGELVKFDYPWAWTLSKESCSLLLVVATNLRLAPQAKWAYWSGGECPVSEGLRVELVLRNGGKINGFDYALFDWQHKDTQSSNHIIAYRIIGLADGWTDDPSKVTA